MNNSNHFDAVIVGGSVAGCAAAHHLLSAGWSVAVLHRENDFPAIESVPPDAARKLRNLAPELGSPINEVTAWWGSDTASNMPCSGAIALQRTALANQARTQVLQQGAQLVPTNRLLAIENSDAAWQVCLRTDDGPRNLQARAIVDATGRAASAARYLGARHQTPDNLCCLSATVANLGPVGVWTESTAEGWWNLCSDGAQATISFFSAPETIPGARANFTDRIARTRHLSSLINLSGSPELRVRPCSSSLLEPCAGPGWVAVGDAAMTFQPLASAGIAKALADAEKVRKALDRPGQYNFSHQSSFRNYLAELAAQYRLETRWPSSPFWSRRLHLSATLSAAA